MINRKTPNEAINYSAKKVKLYGLQRDCSPDNLADCLISANIVSPFYIINSRISYFPLCIAYDAIIW